MPKKKARATEQTKLERTIRAAIAESGLTHGELARRTNGIVDQPQVSRFIAGQVTLRLPAVGALCEALNLELRPKRKRTAQRATNTPAD